MVARLLAEDPDDRYQTAELVITELRAMLTAQAQPQGPEESQPAAPGRLAGEILAGRAAELALLSDRWEQARGGAGGVMLIRGAGGC